MRKHRMHIVASLLILLMVCITFPQNAMAETIYIDPKADVVFTIDATGSMGTYIESVKDNLSAFIKQVSSADVDVRIRFIIFRDITCDEETVCSDWFLSADDAQAYLEKINATGGGDGPETLLDGMGAMLTDSFGFRDDAAKFCVALTDASTKLMNSYGFKTENEVIDNLKTRGVITSIITRTACESLYSKYVTEDLGILADIEGDYSIVLKQLGDTVISGASKFSTTGITPSYTTEGTAAVVKVYGKDLTYAEDFSVSLNKTKMTVKKKTETYFEFSVPASMKVGNYDVMVVNNGVSTKVGNFSVAKKVKFVGKMKMTPNTSVEGTTTTVKVTCPDMTYGKDFAIKLGKTKMAIAYRGDSYFKFTVPASLKADTYTVTMVNDGTESVLGEYIVQAKPVPVLTMKMNQTTSKAGTVATVKVSVSGGTLSYKDFIVKLGNTKMSVTYRGDTYFKFTIPATVSEGTYAVTVSNEGTEYELGNYVLTPKPAPPAPTMKMNQTTSKAGTAATVKVSVSGGTLSYKDFIVKLGNTKMSVTYRGDTYFKFTIPATVNEGTYEVTVSNEGKEYAIGSYVVTPKPAPPALTMSLGQTTSVQGTATNVKVNVSGGTMKYQSDFSVKLGNTKMNIAYRGDTYFKFTVPASTAAGTYTVSIVNGGESKEVGTYIIKNKVVPVPTFGKLSVTSAKSSERTTVKVTYTNMSYASDFKIEIGDTKAVMAYKGDTYFKFYTPVGIKNGTYDVTVTNGGKKYVIGAITFK